MAGTNVLLDPTLRRQVPQHQNKDLKYIQTYTDLYFATRVGKGSAKTKDAN